MNLEGVKGRVAGEDGSQIYVTVLRREGVKPDVAVTHPYRKQDARRIMVESVAPVQGGIASCPIFAVPKISSRDREARDLGRILCSSELKFRQSSLLPRVEISAKFFAEHVFSVWPEFGE